MARELRRLLIGADRLAAAGGADPSGADPSGADPSGTGAEPIPCLVLSDAERHYLQRVLRLRPGDRVAVLDGCGRLWSAVLMGVERLKLEQPLSQPLRSESPPAPLLQLALALPRRDVELVWRMATELGIDSLQPLQAERCVLSGRPALERWRVVVIEACEQCERLWLPAITEPAQALRWLVGSSGAQSATAAGVGQRLLATTRREGLPLLSARLRELSSTCGEVSVAVGPEGGWSPAEEEAAITAGWQPVSLGPLILRSGTAAVAAATQLAAWRDLGRAAVQDFR